MLIVALAIFLLTYFLIATIERVPRISIDRPAAALLGATLMVLFGILKPAEAFQAIDFNTITLLLGMMIIVSILAIAGFFDWLAYKAVKIADTPLKFLALVVVATAGLSAILVNDTVVLLFTPVIIKVARLYKLNPIPFLIGEILAANIGSVATIVGNPQNMLIGISSNITFAKFSMYLAPVSIVSLLIAFSVLVLFYRKEVSQPISKIGIPEFQVKNPVLMKKALA
ncbi:MAG: SLC13 family permease, partial [Euryarchaeota archaeon]|nr:SLC13 family permease [Euryarchaeota archaeon]